MLPSSVDLLEDLLVGGESVRHLVGVDGLLVDEDLEDPAGAFLKLRGESVLGLDGGLQTGGLGEVVSLPAVQDRDVHAVLLSPERGLHSSTMPGRRQRIPWRA